MNADLDRLLDLLLDETRPIPDERASELSDLDTSQMKQLEAVWPRLSAERRRTLVSKLGTLANQHIELTFERVNRYALRDEDAEVRRSAIKNLWESEDPALVPPLLEALADPASEVRSAAAAALGQFVYLGEVEAVDAALLHRIEEALLHAVSVDPEGDVRARSLESLGYSSREEVLPLVEEAYASGDAFLVQSSLLAMGRSVNAAWGPRVLAELHNPSPALRAEAVRAAGELELHDAISDLIELTEDVDREVRRAAIWSLAQLGGGRAAGVLTNLLETTEDESEIALLEDALDYLAFVDGTRDIALFDFDDDQDLAD